MSLSSDLINTLYFGLMVYFAIITISLVVIWRSFHESDKKLFMESSNVVILVLIYLPVLIGIALRLRGLING